MSFAKLIFVKLKNITMLFHMVFAARMQYLQQVLTRCAKIYNLQDILLGND